MPLYPKGSSVWYRHLCFRVIAIYELEDGTIVYELEPSIGFQTPGNSVFALAKYVILDLQHSHNLRVYHEEESDDPSDAASDEYSGEDGWPLLLD